MAPMPRAIRRRGRLQLCSDLALLLIGLKGELLPDRNDVPQPRRQRRRQLRPGSRPPPGAANPDALNQKDASPPGFVLAAGRCQLRAQAHTSPSRPVPESVRIRRPEHDDCLAHSGPTVPPTPGVKWSILSLRPSMSRRCGSPPGSRSPRPPVDGEVGNPTALLRSNLQPGRQDASRAKRRSIPALAHSPRSVPAAASSHPTGHKGPPSPREHPNPALSSLPARRQHV